MVHPVRSVLGGWLYAPWARWLVVGIPLAWLVAFLALPLVEVLMMSFTTKLREVQPLFYMAEGGGIATNFTLNAYIELLYDPVFEEWNPQFYAVPLWKSLKLASVSTALILLFAYPMAYWIAISGPRQRLVLLILVLLPFWTPSLLRIYSLFGLMNREGLINQLLLHLSLIDQPLRLRQSDIAVYAGMFITYLPLMVLPLYAALSRLDHRLNEAAADLGANGWTTFRTVTLPLSMPGVIAGCILVFVPAFGEFMVPFMLGGTDHVTIGRKIWQVFERSRDWPGVAALTVVLMSFLVFPVVLYQMRLNDGDSAGEAHASARRNNSGNSGSSGGSNGNSGALSSSRSTGDASGRGQGAAMGGALS